MLTYSDPLIAKGAKVALLIKEDLLYIERSVQDVRNELDDDQKDIDSASRVMSKIRGAAQRVIKKLEDLENVYMEIEESRERMIG